MTSGNWASSSKSWECSWSRTRFGGASQPTAMVEKPPGSTVTNSTVQRHVVAYKLQTGASLEEGKSDGETKVFLTDIPRSGMKG